MDAGNGINVSGNVVSVKVKAEDQFLSVNADGIQTTEALSKAIESAGTEAKKYTDEQISNIKSISSEDIDNIVNATIQEEE